MNFTTFLISSTLLIFPFNLNPFLPLERKFAQPLYTIRSFFHKKDQPPKQVKPKNAYTIVLVGDSMTATLGEENLAEKLKEYYEGKEISVLNYGVGSTTILSLPDTLTKGLVQGDITLFPILSKNPDLILIESFANNPLNMPIEQGLQKTNDILDHSREIVKQKSPETVIIFITTIAPSKNRYGEGILNLSLPERRKAAQDRITYIENHIKYANTKRIPLINIYEKSVDKNGNVKEDYIEKNDFIHPSKKGAEFENEEIANFIFKNRILPL